MPLSMIALPTGGRDFRSRKWPPASFFVSRLSPVALSLSFSPSLYNVALIVARTIQKLDRERERELFRSIFTDSQRAVEYVAVFPRLVSISRVTSPPVVVPGRFAACSSQIHASFARPLCRRPESGSRLERRPSFGRQMSLRSK